MNHPFQCSCGYHDSPVQIWGNIFGIRIAMLCIYLNMKMNYWEFPNKNSKTFPESTIIAVNTFHHDDEHVRRLREAKDYASVGTV